ncbi:MAG: 30S ribosomal protein S17 [Betaproteobacteria bacterium]|nr:30S ribosomal protein S17 [Betaproteobacteria bacterium]
MSEASNTRRIIATATRDSADKTVRVRVERRVKHPLYGKIITRRRSMLAHDENNVARRGERLILEEGRRISRHKAWRVVGKLGGAAQ